MGFGWSSKFLNSCISVDLLTGAEPQLPSKEYSMTAAIPIGTNRELCVDLELIHSTNARLALQKPTQKELCFRFDAPHDGSYNGYHVLIRDGDTLRLYYRAGDLITPDGKKMLELKQATYTCVIESTDGVNWYRPSLGLVEVNGSTDNNIVSNQPSINAAFIPFIDTNPACPADARYKALDYTRSSDAAGKPASRLAAFKSADGFRWTPMFDQPLAMDGAFDSSNLAFWDPTRQTYWAYIRNFHDVPGFPRDDRDHPDLNRRIRDIRWSQSADFRRWSPPEQLDFGGSADIPLYVSAVVPYYRAPGFFLGFPARYIERHDWSPSYGQLPDPVFRRTVMEHHPRYGLALTDCAFMSSRDGKSWRRSEEAFLRPGLGHATNWRYGDGFLSIGMQETPPDLQGAVNDISMYVLEHSWRGNKELRRYTIRPDGFMALAAGSVVSETLTKPFTFAGTQLSLNVSTSVMGGMKVEMQDAGGRAIEGFTMNDCDEILGDRLDYIVHWNGASDVSRLAGKAVRMRLVMADADLFSFRFEP